MQSDLAVSHRLIKLMKWLLQYKQEHLLLLIKAAVEQGFGESIQATSFINTPKSQDQMQKIVPEFIRFLEEGLTHSLETLEINQENSFNLFPTLKKIDFQQFDMNDVWASLQQTQDALARQERIQDLQVMSPLPESMTLPKEAHDPNCLLYSFLLKNWNPENSDGVN